MILLLHIPRFKNQVSPGPNPNPLQFDDLRVVIHGTGFSVWCGLNCQRENVELKKSLEDSKQSAKESVERSREVNQRIARHLQLAYDKNANLENKLNVTTSFLQKLRKYDFLMFHFRLETLVHIDIMVRDSNLQTDVKKALTEFCVCYFRCFCA